MAVPQRRKSSTSVREGRTPKNQASRKRMCQAQPFIKCSNCSEKKILHQICSHCLTYKKLNFGKIKEEIKDKKKNI